MGDRIQIETGAGATYAPDWEAVAKLNEKLATAMSNMGAVEKDAKNTYQGYDYISYENLAATARRAITDAGLSFTVGSGEIESERYKTSKGVEGVDRVLGIEVTFVDTETGAMRVIRGYGEGQDTQDKATAKAFTSGVKYLLLRTLLVSDQEADPDVGPRTHWIQDESTRNKFKGWATNQGLTQEQILGALGVTALTAYAGSKEEAKELIKAAAEMEGEKHWIADEATRNKFWATMSDKGLGRDDVHTALGVESTYDYPGTYKQAIDRVDSWVAEQSK